MFSKLRGFLSRHRRKFVVTGVVLGAAALATRYVQRKLREYQEKESKDFLDRTRRTQHFESTERTCNQTILSLSPVLSESIFKNTNTEELLEQLRTNPKSKLELWEELKIAAFTKVCTVVYASTILVVTLRIQLNLVGGYVYKDSVNNKTVVDGNLQERYLSLCHYFLGDGIKQLGEVIERNVRLVVAPISLKSKLTLSDTEQIFWSIQAAIAKDKLNPVDNVLKFVMPENIDNNEILKAMHLETLDLLESEEVASILMSCISRGFASLVDQIAEYFIPEKKNDTKVVPNNTKSSLDHFVNVNKMEIAMAKLIPIVNGLIPQLSGKLSDMQDSLIQQLILNDKIKTLGANVYEVFSH